MARFLIILGITILILGLLWPYLGRMGLGRLPGDVLIERDNFALYIPLMTSLLISIVLSLFLWLVNQFTGQ
jgi:hydrogenase-4 membrane subunit HyfE